MSISRKLKARRDVDNADIPDIIERAEKLRIEDERQRNRERNRSSIEDVREVGRELAIPDQFVEQAIHDLQAERERAQRQQQQQAESNREASQERRRLIQQVIRIAGAIVIGIFLVRGIQWLWVALNFVPESESPVDQSTAQQTVIHEKETIREVIKVVEVPVPTEPPSKTSKTKTKRSDKKKAKEPISQPAVQSSSPNPLSKVEEPTKVNEPVQSSVATVVQKPKVEDPKVETIAKETPQVVEETPPPSDKQKEKEIIKEATEPVALPKVASKIQGEWTLDSYLLYEKGVEYPMEVPIVYEPLELPKTWRFSNGRYKRVMDKSLSFSAKYQVVSLPKNLQPIVDDTGTWAQIVASNVVSTIPGIRRQNDYFAVLVDGDVLTIWYLGPNAYRKKLPTQAERYVRN